MSKTEHSGTVVDAGVAEADQQQAERGKDVAGLMTALRVEARRRGQELVGALEIMLRNTLESSGVAFEAMSVSDQHELTRGLFEELVMGAMAEMREGDWLCEECASKGVQAALNTWNKGQGDAFEEARSTGEEHEAGVIAAQRVAERLASVAAIGNDQADDGLVEENIGGVHVIAAKGGVVWVEFETPDAFAMKRPQLGSDGLAMAYAHWWRTEFNLVCLVAMNMCQSGLGGIRRVVLFDGGAYARQVGRGMGGLGPVALQGMCVEVSGHQEKRQRKAEKSDLFLLTVDGRAIGCILTGKDEQDEVVWQKNVFGFAHEAILNSPEIGQSKYQMALGEQVALQEGLAVRFMGTVELEMCQERRMLACPVMERGKESTKGTATLH